jgi:hypothetical protein
VQRLGSTAAVPPELRLFNLSVSALVWDQQGLSHKATMTVSDILVSLSDYVDSALALSHSTVYMYLAILGAVGLAILPITYRFSHLLRLGGDMSLAATFLRAVGSTHAERALVVVCALMTFVMSALMLIGLAAVRCTASCSSVGLIMY